MFEEKKMASALFGGENVINLFTLIVESLPVRGDNHVYKKFIVVVIDLEGKPHVDVKEDISCLIVN